MTKVTTSRVFDVARISSAKSYGELQPFVQFVTAYVDNSIRILLNGVSLGDNIDSGVFTVKVKHNTQTTISTTKRPYVAFVGFQAVATPVVTCSFTVTNSGGLLVTPIFSDPLSTAEIEIRIVVFYS